MSLKLQYRVTPKGTWKKTSVSVKAVEAVSRDAVGYTEMFAQDNQTSPGKIALRLVDDSGKEVWAHESDQEANSPKKALKESLVEMIMEASKPNYNSVESVVRDALDSYKDTGNAAYLNKAVRKVKNAGIKYPMKPESVADGKEFKFQHVSNDKTLTSGSDLEDRDYAIFLTFCYDFKIAIPEPK